MKIVLPILILLSCATLSFAQQTTVTGTIVDPNGTPYSNCNITANYQDPPPSPSITRAATINGSPLPSRTISSACNSFGVFTLVLWDTNVINYGGQTGGGTWQYTVSMTIQAGTIPPWFGTPTIPNFSRTSPVCPTVGCITGTTVDITAVLQPIPLLPFSGGGFLSQTVGSTNAPTFQSGADTLFNFTLNQNVTASVFSTSVATGRGRIFQINICQNATGGFTMTWPSNVSLPVGYVFSTAAGVCSPVAFRTIDGGVTWTGWEMLSGGGGGGAPGAPLNSIQKSAGGTFTASNCVETSVTLNCDDDFHVKGPNPYIDVTRYGVRAMSPINTPAISGITVTINSGSTSAAVSTSSCPGQTGSVCFVNGDGVTIYNAGTTHSMTTPTGVTVTPSIAAAGTGTGIVTNGTIGSTTYNYQVFAVNTSRGATAASSVATTTTGAGSLGRQSVSNSTLTRSGNVTTVTTSSVHGFVVGCTSNCGQVYISQTSDDVNWGGWFAIASVPSTTTYTLLTGLDTRNGAPISATGGTSVWFNLNHITWTAVTGAWQYCVYGRTGGSLIWIGCTHPADTTFDDFGSTMMAGYTQPGWVPNTPPVSSTSNSLVTTIVSGAGTTTLILANAASTTVTNGPIRFDNALNYTTAANIAATNQNGILFFPAANGLQYVFNSFVALPQNSSTSFSGALSLNDTIQANESTIWTGDTIRLGYPVTSFAQGSGAFIGITEANPGIYVPNGLTTNWKRLSFGAQNVLNGANPFLGDGVFPITFEDVNFGTGSSSTDYMGIGLILRNSSANFFKNVMFTGGPTQVNGVTDTPFFYCNVCGLTKMDSINFTLRGILFNAQAAGAAFELNTGRIQGGLEPLITYTAQFGGPNTAVTIRNFEQDTMAHPIFTIVGGNVLLMLESAGFPQGVNGATAPLVSGIPITEIIAENQQTLGAQPLTGQNTQTRTFPSGASLDGTINTAPASFAIQQFNSVVAIGKAYSLFTAGPTPAAPTAVISSGGAIPTGTHVFEVIPVWANGAEGNLSPASNSVNVTTGNQTVTVTWTAVIPTPLGYDVYEDGTLVSLGSGGNCTTIPQYAATATSAIISSFICGSGSTIPSGGPTVVNSKGVFTSSLDLTPVFFANLGTPVNGTLYFCPDCVQQNPCAGSGGGAIAQRIAGVWNCSGGAGGGIGTGTQNCIVDWATTSSLGSVCSNVSGQVPTAQNAAPPVYTSQSFTDSASSPVVTTPYTIGCDTATSLVDRGHSIRFQTGASAITIPLSSASGCPGLVTTAVNDNAATLTFTRSSGDTLTVCNGASCTDSQTSFTLTTGQDATISQNAANLWLIRIHTSGGGVSSWSGDGVLSNNSSSIGAVTLTFANAPAHKYWGNNTGSAAAPNYVSLVVADLPTGIPNANLANASTTVNTQTCTLGASCTIGYANIAAGAIANGSTGTTQACGDNSTDIATDQFVSNCFSGTANKSDVLNQSTSQSTVTLSTAPTAGLYRIHYYADLNTPCTTGANTVSFTYNWTDASNARSLTTGSLTLGASQTTAEFLSGIFDIWVASGNVTYTSIVVGACASGTSSYDIHARLEKTP